MRAWLKKGFQWMLYLGIILFLGLASLVGYSYWRVDRALHAYAPRGFARTYDELVPPAPDEENGAVVLREMVESIGKPPDNVGKVADCLEPARADSAACQETLAQGMEEAAAWHKEKKPALHYIEHILEKPKYRINAPASDPDIIFPPLASIKLSGIFRLAVLDIHFSLARRDLDSTTNTIVDYWNFLDYYGRQSRLATTYAATVVLQQIMLNLVKNFIEKYPFNPQQVAKIFTALQNFHLKEYYAKSLQGDALLNAIYLNLWRQYFSKDAWLQGTKMEFLALTALRPFDCLGMYYYNTGLADMLEAAYQLQDILSLPSNEGLPRHAVIARAIDGDNKPAFGHFYPFTPWNHAALISDTYTSLFTHQARYDLARLHVAVALHRARHGAPPEALDSLDRDILDPIPRDVFTGEPLSYTAKPDGEFIVESPGLDHYLAEQWRKDQEKTASN
ncbi:MAG: hypothetical protein AB1916_03780 [Thermodesulfobacteriota bacterium]